MQTITLIYDGDCLLCNHSAKALKIRAAVGKLETINAREAHPLVDEVKRLGYDLNQGIIVRYHGKFYYGKQAVHLLAMLSSPVDGFNRLAAKFFRAKWMASLLYPLFKVIRRVLLFLRRTPMID